MAQALGVVKTGTVELDGATSGSITFVVPAVAGTQTHTFQAATGTIPLLSGANQVWGNSQDFSACSAVKVPTVAFGDDSTNAASTNYVLTAIAGVAAIHPPCVAASQTNITVSAPGATIDGVSPSSGDRILLVGQTAPAENGPWVWNGAAVPMTRPTDFASGATNLAVKYVGFDVIGGTVNGGTFWYITTAGTITIDTTPIAFTQFAWNLSDGFVQNILTVGKGGTGLNALTTNGVLLGNGTSPVTVTAAGVADNILRVPGAGGTPAFGSIDLSKSGAVGSSILGVTNGGTGASSFTANQILYGNGSGALQSSANLTFTGGNLLTTGALTVSNGDIVHTGSTICYLGATGGAGYAIRIRGAAGTTRNFGFYSGNTIRCDFRIDNTAETGSDAGSTLASGLYTDAGVLIDNWLVAVRASGGPITLGGTSARPVAFAGRINLASIAATTNNGDLWQDSTQKSLGTYQNGLKGMVPQVVYTSTADATVANTVTATSIIGTGVGTKTLPANWAVIGKELQIYVDGIISDTGTPNFTMDIRLGSTVIATGTVTLPNGLTNAKLTGMALLTFRTIGATGTVMGGGRFTITTSAGNVTAVPIAATAVTTIDTTVSQVADIFVTWGTASASNTVTGQQSRYVTGN